MRGLLVLVAGAYACGPAPGMHPGPQPIPVEATPRGQVVDRPPHGHQAGDERAGMTPHTGPRQLDEAPAPPADYRLLPPLDSGPIEASFRAAYNRAERPRLAVFFNRELSDEVREWIEPQRTSTYTRDTRVVTPHGVDRERETVTTESRPGHRPVSDRRPAIDEGVSWQVEAAFSGPLLAQNVRLVDRATIMRLVAHASGKQDDPKADLAIKHIEMSALLGHADYFVELLVRRSGSRLGYDLKATVKEVKTGQIVANLTTASWTLASPPPPPKPRQEVVATDRGYEYRDVPPPPPPKAIAPAPHEVAERMSLRVMEQLSGSWSGR